VFIGESRIEEPAPWAGDSPPLLARKGRGAVCSRCRPNGASEPLQRGRRLNRTRTGTPS